MTSVSSFPLFCVFSACAGERGGFTPRRKVRQGRKEDRSIWLCGSLPPRGFGSDFVTSIEILIRLAGISSPRVSYNCSIEAGVCQAENSKAPRTPYDEAR